MPFRFTPAVLAVLVGTSAVPADPKNPTFDADVLPVLRQHCLGCHSADKQKGGLDLSTFAALKAGGSSGDVLKPGDPDKSRVFSLTAHAEEPKMPPKASRIPDAQLSLLKLWVEQGGRENAGSKVAVSKPKVDLGLTLSAKGKPDGPPPMPLAGKLRVEPVVVARRANAVVALAASPWAPLVAVGGQKQILLYHADAGTLLGVLPFDHGQINALKFSRNGKLLLAAGGRGGASGKAVLYEVETGRAVAEVGSAETDAVLAADVSADGSLVAVGTPTKMVRVYRTADGEVASAVKKHTDWVTAVEFSPDGVLLATGDRNGGVFVWEAATGREFYALPGNTSTVTDLSWRPDSNVLASAAETGHVRLWEMENGTPVKNWVSHPGGAQSVRYAADGRLATTGRDRLVKLWDGNGGLQKQAAAPLADIGLRVAVTADGAKVVAGDWAGRVTTWATADGKPGPTFDANPPPLAVRVRLAEEGVAAAEAKVKQAEAALAAAAAKVVRANWAAASAAAGAGVKVYIDKIAADAKAATAAIPAAQAAVQAATAEVAAAKGRLEQTRGVRVAQDAPQGRP
jgi:WD40 repeat protein